MGDMADMILDQMWDDPFGDDEPDPPAFITCKYCKVDGFEWRTINGKWRLHTPDGKLHQCKVNPLPVPVVKPPVEKTLIQKAFEAGFDRGYKSAMNEAYPEVGPGPLPVSVEEAYQEFKSRK